MMRRGFTLVELILVIGIFAVLASLTSINFFRTYPSSSVRAQADILLADLKSQQSRAMSGEAVNGTQVSGWGLQVLPDSYVLFSGSTYVPLAPSNTVVSLPTNVTLTSNLPGPGQVVFLRGSGEINGYIAGQDSLTISSSDNTQLIRLNRYGAITAD